MGQSCGQGIASEAFLGADRPGLPQLIGEPEFIPGASYPSQWGTSHGRPKEEDEDEEQVRVRADKFRVHVSEDTSQPVEYSDSLRRGWRGHYSLGPMLGDGVSAKVYEAEALSVLPRGVAGEGSGSVTTSSYASKLQAGFLERCGRLPPCLVERGRKVAIKRFHRVGSRTFRKELTALQQVGVYPHILRLLESYEGCDGEDVLVLEYCDGSTVYDLYAREHPNGGLPERLVGKLVRQLLLALEHLTDCGVEHQDVKPENMMLYDVSVSNAQAELKLGDFGWAVVLPPPGHPVAKPPATGAGSLWYAPPELNPPVAGVEQPSNVDYLGNPPRGKSDMWCVGVVTYLLLVGHNPFNAALSLQHPQAVDAEVMRLAASGQFNRKSEKWLRLHGDVRDFIAAMLRVSACLRPTAKEALQHPYVVKRQKGLEGSVFFHGPVTNWAEREATWRQLDGLQRLGWLAVARAVAEPELDRQVICAALEGMKADSGVVPADSGYPQETAYIWQLAKEIGTSAVNQWLQDRPAWAEILRLAFAYLDLDGDGLLGYRDLMTHAALFSAHPVRAGQRNETLERVVGRWIARWQDPDAPAVFTNSGQQGLPLESLRAALLSSQCNNEDSIFNAFDDHHSASLKGEAYLGHGPGMHVDGKMEHTEEEITWPSTVGFQAACGGHRAALPTAVVVAAPLHRGPYPPLQGY
eukprot:TRINITY_DN22049_c0_g1_i1.p1 TRINITY_DN22049_c0_g1~~TRINITY_DN22049_c0_g1_i1.p1  ORF type:complete len:693 (+),score=135.46 TRINITY_DN22049_c0_g1_i1:107-2185(+)